MKITEHAVLIVKPNYHKIIAGYCSLEMAQLAVDKGFLDNYKPAEFCVGTVTFKTDEHVKLPNTCSQCKHFCHVPSKHGYMNAECRYNPPTHDGFPNVSDSHWCRCFEEKT